MSNCSCFLAKPSVEVTLRRPRLGGYYRPATRRPTTTTSTAPGPSRRMRAKQSGNCPLPQSLPLLSALLHKFSVCVLTYCIALCIRVNVSHSTEEEPSKGCIYLFASGADKDAIEKTITYLYDIKCWQFSNQMIEPVSVQCNLSPIVIQ